MIGASLVIFLLSLSSISCNDVDIPAAIEDMLAMVKTLSAESTERHWKINTIADDVQCIQKDYVSLKQRVELLKKSSAADSDSDSDADSVTCVAHAQDTNVALTDIQNCVDEAKQVLEEVDGFVHPCGGPGWRLAVYLDMNVPNAQCPNGWDLITQNQFTQSCTSSAGDMSCSTATYQMSESYNQVCGRVHAYSLGREGGFDAYYTAGADTSTGVDEFFATGVILTRGGDEHIFSFIAGSPMVDQHGSTTEFTDRCPCLTGEDSFIETHGELPSFLNGDYFCETSTNVVAYYSQVSLWDGLNCEDGSECCDHGSPPYFTKVLDTATNEALEIKICEEIPELSETLNVHFMEIYVK